VDERERGGGREENENWEMRLRLRPESMIYVRSYSLCIKMKVTLVILHKLRKIIIIVRKREIMS
jgi:hypothetical protein